MFKINEYEEYLEKLFIKVLIGVMYIFDCYFFNVYLSYYVILIYEEIKLIRNKYIRVFNVCNNIL